MPDIHSRNDIEFLVDTFYQQVVQDPVIGYVFTEVISLSWEKHIPIMYSFWETVLLGKMSYQGNPVQKHIALNQKERLQALHFERWIQLWEATVRKHFQGQVAEEAIRRAKLMGQVLQSKLVQSEKPGFIQ